MNKSRIIKSGFKVMKRYKLRTFFMTLGIIIGATALTLILSLGRGTQKQLTDKVERIFNASNILIQSGGGEIKSRPNFDKPVGTLSLDDIKEIQEQAPNIANYDAFQVIPGRAVKYKEKSQDLRIFGNTPKAKEVWNRGVVSGAYFTDTDMIQSARVALVGTGVVKDLFAGIDPVGEQIRIGNTPFQVIGVLEPMGVDPHGLNRDYEISVPITTLMRRLMNTDYIGGAKLQLADKTKIKETVTAITRILRKRHHIAENEPDDFTIITPEMIRKIIAKMNNVFIFFLPLLAGVALLVGGVVVASLMLMTVNQRTGEIGLRRALGARSKDILLQFIVETIVITLFGWLFGFLLGTAGLLVFVFKMNLPLVIPWEAFILGMVFSTIIGAAAGIIPARRAASLDPVEALR